MGEAPRVGGRPQGLMQPEIKVASDPEALVFPSTAPSLPDAPFVRAPQSHRC